MIPVICWRISAEFEVEVTDTCNGWSDSVIVEMGKVTIDIEDTAIKRVSETFEVEVSLINHDHHVRALTPISVSVIAVIVYNAPGV